MYDDVEASDTAVEGGTSTGPSLSVVPGQHSVAQRIGSADDGRQTPHPVPNTLAVRSSLRRANRSLTAARSAPQSAPTLGRGSATTEMKARQ